MVHGFFRFGIGLGFRVLELLGFGAIAVPKRLPERRNIGLGGLERN